MASQTPALDCLFKSVIKLTKKETSRFHITGPSWGEGPAIWNNIHKYKLHIMHMLYEAILTWFKHCMIHIVCVFVTCLQSFCITTAPYLYINIFINSLKNHIDALSPFNFVLITRDLCIEAGAMLHNLVVSLMYVSTDINDPIGWNALLILDDVIKWRHFPHYWPFVWGIHRSPVDSRHKGEWRGALMFYLINKRLSKQSRNRWLETPSRLLWRHCNDNAYRPSAVHYDIT